MFFVLLTDRPGLRNVEFIERMHKQLKSALQSVLMQNHPDRPSLCQELLKKIPDLRTLNTLHSEKLLAFKMTEQQNQLDQQQQQQQQQHQENNQHHQIGSAGGVWSIMMNAADDFNRKSPEEAGSSSWSDETASVEDMKSNLSMLDEVKSPLGSVSSTESVCSDEYNHHHNHHHGPSKHAASAPLLAATLAGAVCPIRRHGVASSDDHHHHHLHHHLQQHHQVIVRPMSSCRYQRKQDSPTDSGIESGTEKLDRPSAAHSAPTSVCSSPRSTVEDSMMMFSSSASTTTTTISIASADSDPSPSPAPAVVEDMPVLKRVLQAPPLYDTNSLMDEAYKPHKKFRALRGAKDSAEAEAVRPVVAAAASTVTVDRRLPSHHHDNHHNIIHSSPQLHHHLTTMSSTLASSLSSAASSSLSSTHSTLAKSLRETPKMTAEQIKRTEAIHNFIMREDTTVAAVSAPSCTVTTYQQQQQPPTRWQHTPVITSASALQQNTSRLSSPSSSSASPPPQQAIAIARRRCTPSPNNVVNLQVGITNAEAAAIHHQPLNLSKKLCPSPTPAVGSAGAATPPPSAPAQVAMEA